MAKDYTKGFVGGTTDIYTKKTPRKTKEEKENEKYTRGFVGEGADQAVSKIQLNTDYINDFRQRLSSAYDEYQKTFGNQQYNTQDTFNNFLKKYQNQFSDDSYLKYTRALRELQQAGAISNSDHTDLLKSTPYMSDINKSVKNMADYMAQYKNEEEYNRSGRYALKYSGMSDKDLKASADEVMSAYKKATGPEKAALKQEYDWLFNYAPGNAGTEIRSARIKDNEQRIAEIEQELKGFIPYQQGKYTKEQLDHYRELERERDTLRAENNKYSRGETYVTDKYGKYAQNADFAATSKQRKFDTSVVNEQEIAARLNPDNWRTSFDGKTYDQYGNEITQEYLDEWRRKGSVQDKLGVYLGASDEDIANAQMTSNNTNGSYDNILNEGRSRYWDLLTENEKDMYYYLLNKEGQQAAYEYLDDLDITLGRRNNEKQIQQYNSLNWLGKVAYNIGTVPASILGGIIGGIDDKINQIQGKDINPYSIAHSASNFASGVREQTAQDLSAKDEYGNRIKFLGLVDFGDVYQAIMSGIDSAVGAAFFGNVGGTVTSYSTAASYGYGLAMGMGAMESEARELFEAGATSQEIFTGSLLAGVAEEVFETVSLDKILHLKDVNSVRDWVSNILKSGFIEGSEEFATEIATTLTDMAVRGTQSGALQSYYNYRDQGISQGQASMMALRDIGITATQAFIGGAISGAAGGFSRGGTQLARYVAPFYGQASSAIKGNNVQGIYDTADQFGVDYSKAQQKVNEFLKEGRGRAGAVSATANVLKNVDRTRTSQNTADMQQKLQDQGISERRAKKIAQTLSDIMERKRADDIEFNRDIDIGAFIGEEDLKVFKGDKNVAIDVLKQAMGGSVANRNFEYEARLEGDKETAEYIKNERIAAAAPKLSFDGTVNGQSSSFTYDHIDGDTLYVKTADGQVVKADDVQTTNRNAIQVMQDSTLFGENGAKAYLNAYDGSNASTYRQTFTTIYNQAKSGIDVQTVIAEAMSGGVSEKLARIAAYTGENAYRAVQRFDEQAILKYFDKTEAEKILENLKQTAKGQESEIEQENKAAEEKDLSDVKEKYKKTFEDEHVRIKDVDWSKLDSKKQESIAGITMFIRALGRDVVIEGAIDYKNGNVIYRNAANAYFDPADNSYHFNVSMMDNAYFNVAIHESIHDLAKNNYAAYKQIRDKLIELCDNDTSGMMDDFAHELDRLMKADTKGDVLDVAYEEWVANTVSGILADPNTFSQFANRFMDEETRSTFLQLIDAIMDYIREAFDKIKTRLGWQQAQILENDLNALQEIRDMYFSALEGITNPTKSVQEYNAYEPNNEILELCKKVKAGKISISDTIHLTEIDENARRVLSDYYGFEVDGTTLYLEPKQVKHIIDRHGANGKDDKTMSSDIDIAKMEYIIKNYDKIYDGGVTTAYSEQRNGKNHPARTCIYEKKLDDKHYFVVQTVADSNSKKQRVVSAYMETISFEEHAAENKKIVVTLLLDTTQNMGPKKTSINVTASPTTIYNIDAQSEDVKSSVNTDVLENRAAEEFGTTYDWNETGYILTDGRRLDLSEKNNGGPRGHRSADHRIVGTLYEDLHGTAAMVDFMNRGNIRILPESGGIDLSVAPNKAQLSALDSFISKNRGEIIVDISDTNGNNLYSWEYPKGTYSKKILNDISNYFKDGTQPTISELTKFRYSSNSEILDEQYMAAINAKDMTKAQQMVDDAAERAGYVPSNMFHGSMNATFHVFDKSKANPEGNSGAGFYFTTNPEDAEQNYADVEGADNFFKTSALADKIFKDGEWNGIEVEDYDHAKQLAKDLLNKEPGTYEVYLKYDNPYYRDYRNSTDILAKIMDDFDESLVDRDDYDTNEDYEEDLMYARDEHIGEAVDRAVYRAYSDIEDQYEVIDGPFAQDVVSAIMEEIYNDDSLTWNDIKKAIEGLNIELTVTRTDSIDTEFASAEFTRAIIENFGYDAIYDKEVSTKFNQLNSNGREADHIIVFHPNQIKLSDPVTYDDQGNVIPLSKRFNTNKDDIRFSANIDSEGNKLSEEQQEYFAESKVRDKDGRLLLVYHGSPNANITVFDRSFAGRHTEAYHDKMIWFTDNEQFADTFAHEFEDLGYTSFRVGLGKKGKVYPGYLNMKKPFDLRNPTEEMVEYLIKNRVEMWGADREYAVKDINSLLYEYGNHQMLKLYIKSMDDLRNMGYDGIIARLDTFIHNDDSLEYGIFESNQFKYADNKNPTENPDIRYSAVTDPETIAFLDNQDHVTVYRAMVEINGKLYPPMATKIRNAETGKYELQEPTELGVWYRSEERPDLRKNDKFTLKKDVGTDVNAAYNPYWHTSLSVLNDQFTSAYKRPNLVVVKGEVPSSELTSGYKAEEAKDAVGKTEWHSGTVSSDLKKAGKNAREVILSRWFRATAILSDTEVAREIAELVRDTDVEIPFNVVTPGVRAELEKLGVPIGNSRGLKEELSKDIRYSSNEDVVPIEQRTFTYDEFLNKDHVIVSEYDKSIDYDSLTRSDVVSNALENAKEYGYVDNNGGVHVIVDDTNTDVLITTHGLSHGLDRRFNLNKTAVVNIGSVLKSSILMNVLEPRKHEVESYVFIGMLQTNNGYDLVESVVNRFTYQLEEVNTLFSVNAKEEAAVSAAITSLNVEPLGSNPPTYRSENSLVTSVPIIRINDFLSFVNEKYADILPADVYKHYGHKDRPKGKLGESARYSSNLDSLNNSDEHNVENLKQTIGDQYRLTVGKQMTLPAAEKIARDVTRRTNSQADKAALATELKDLFDDAARQGKDLDTDAFIEAGTKIMRGVLEKSGTFDQTAYDNDEPLRKYLRETGISLNEIQQGEAKYLYESVAKYRQSLFGMANITNKGIPLDVAWAELNRMDPGWFPSDVNDGDMVHYLYDAVKGLTKANYYVNEYGFDLDGAAAYEFAQVIADYTENKRIKNFVQQLRTYGKRYLDNELKEIRKTRREKMAVQSRLYEEQRKRNISLKNEIANLNRQLSGEAQNIERDITFLQSRLKYAEPGVDELSIREQIADLEQDKANLEARYREEIRNKTAQLREGQEELEKIGKEYIKAGSTNTSLALDARKAAIGTKSAVKLRAQKEAQEIRTLQNNIRKKSSNLMSRLISGTDTKHVPENLREAVTGFLQAVDLGWNQGTLAAEKWLSDLNVLADKMAAANEMNGNFQVDSMIIDQLREMGARITERLSLAGKNLRTMSIAELNQLDDALSLVNAAIYNSDRLLADDRKQRASAVAERSITEMGKKKQRKHTNDLLGRIGNFFTLDQLDSFSYAERIGGPFKDVIFKNLRKAFDKKVKLVQEGIDAYNRAASVFGKTEKGILSKIKSMSGNNAQTQTFKLDNGKTLTLNTAQIMELYLLNERDQARIHLYNGGITVEEYKAKDGTVKKQEFIKVTEDDIDRIIGTLTKEQKKFANELQKYASSNMSEWGNDVSLTLWGVKKFTEQNYWPITVDDNTTDAVSQDKKNGNVGLYHLKNIGMSKAVNPKANNALVIGDVIDTYIRHVDEMTSYAAYTIPLDDAMKWYNYKNGNQTVQRSIESLMGKGGKAWFTDFIRALNNSQDMSGGMDFADTMIRNAKVAAIAANLRVVIQQPSAYARAAETIDPKYLLNVNNLKVKQGAKEAQEHSSIAKWKNWGFRDVNVGGNLRSLMVGDDAFLEQVREKAGIPAGKFDDATWGALWNACKAEVEDKRPDLVKGSQEYYDAIDERFTEVIDRTQVVDSPFHRSKAMRSKNALWKMYTAFMSEPTKTYNMFYKTISNAYQGNWSAETRKAVVRATFTFVAATILNSALAAIVDVGRDTDDEDWWEKYLKNMGKNMLDGFNPLNLIPIGKDIMSLFDGYDATRMDLDAVSDLIKQFKRAGSVFTGEKNYNWWKIAYDTTMAASKITGIPAGNVWRLVTSVMNLAGVDVSVFKGTWNNTNAKAVAEDMYSYFAKGDMAGFQRVFDKYVEDEVSKMVEEDTKTLEETGQHKYDSTESMQNKATKAVLNKLAQQLADNEEQIAEAYLAKTIGDGSEVMRIRNEYIAKGIPEEVFDKAVNLYGSSINTSPQGVNELNSKLYSYDDLYAAIESGDLEDIEYIIDEMKDDSTAQNPEKAIKDRVIAEFKDEYYEYIGSGQTAKASQLESTVTQAFNLDTDDLSSWKTGYQMYAFTQKVPEAESIDAKSTASFINKYNEFCKAKNVPEMAYYNVYMFEKGSYGEVDSKGKSIPYSKCVKVMAYINSLNVTAEQKTALALCYYGQSTVDNYKLW